MKDRVSDFDDSRRQYLFIYIYVYVCSMPNLTLVNGSIFSGFLSPKPHFWINRLKGGLKILNIHLYIHTYVEYKLYALFDGFFLKNANLNWYIHHIYVYIISLKFDDLRSICRYETIEPNFIMLYTFFKIFFYPKIIFVQLGYMVTLWHSPPKSMTFGVKCNFCIIQNLKLENVFSMNKSVCHSRPTLIVFSANM